MDHTTLKSRPASVTALPKLPAPLASVLAAALSAMTAVSTALAAVLAVAAPPSSASADIIQVYAGGELRYAVYGMPDFDQRRTASGSIPGLPYGGISHCAPTSAADVLTYLSSHAVGGIPFVPSDSWLDYDAGEYLASNNIIASCAGAMHTNVGGSGTLVRDLDLALVQYLEPDRYSYAWLGGASGDAIGLPIDTIAYALSSPLFQRPVAMACVAWMRPWEDDPSLWRWGGGHCIAVAGVTWSADGWKTLQIRDPDDAQRLNPSEPLTAQSPFASMTYPVLNQSFPMAWGATLRGGNVLGLSAAGRPALLTNMLVAYPTTVFSLDDLAGTLIRSHRPVRMEADDPSPIQVLAPPLAQSASELVFDMVAQRLFVLEGSGAGAKVKSVNGRGDAAVHFPTAVAPTRIAAGRFGELAIFGMQGTVPTLEIARTVGQSAPVYRTLPGLPDAACYDDASDQVCAYVAAPRLLVTIPRNPAQQMASYTVPTSIFLEGTVHMCAEPGTGAIWLAASGTTGKMYRLTLGPSGTIASIATAVSPAIAAPRRPVALSQDVLTFASGNALRVLRRDGVTGAWAADADSPLWGVPVGAGFDISRARNNFEDGDPVWDLALDTPPDSPVTPDAACVADLNLDDRVDGADLATLLGSWGADGMGDLDQNDTIDGADLGALLAQWGPCP